MPQSDPYKARTRIATPLELPVMPFARERVLGQRTLYQSVTHMWTCIIESVETGRCVDQTIRRPSTFTIFIPAPPKSATLPTLSTLPTLPTLPTTMDFDGMLTMRFGEFRLSRRRNSSDYGWEMEPTKSACGGDRRGVGLAPKITHAVSARLGTAGHRLAAILDERIVALNRLRQQLGSCIGCGCLSLDTCGLVQNALTPNAARHRPLVRHPDTDHRVDVPTTATPAPRSIGEAQARHGWGTARVASR